ncbi:MAG: ferredoxin reductase [Pseudonocardiales bacterium]|nr:ferredoxin reductase [Pseudonocardiales bacterium]
MTEPVQRIVIVGGGLAGAKATEALRERGFSGSVTLIGDEMHLPYERPPLSKSYLMNRSPFEDAIVHDADWYAEHDVDLRLGTHATALDPAAHDVTLADGTQLRYDRLLLATGASPRRLTIAGADAEGVHYLRRREDSDAIRATFGPGRRLVIIGAGWIGLEVAAAARQAGTDVTVVEMAHLPLLAVLGRELAQVFADLHTVNGVDLRLDAHVQEVRTEGGRVTGLLLGDGSAVTADAIVVGIGVLPNVELAEAAGLDVDNGVLVEASLQTSNPDIFAVGDIANHAHPVLGRRVRVEHWAAALNQPATAAAAMLGADARYEQLPYFYSDQYDLGMEYVGHAPPGEYDRVVVRGDLAAREFVAFWLDDANRIKAAMNVNVWDVIDEIKPLIAAGTPVDAARLADPAVGYAYVMS